jgi:hypothetical protein
VLRKASRPTMYRWSRLRGAGRKSRGGWTIESTSSMSMSIGAFWNSPSQSISYGGGISGNPLLYVRTVEKAGRQAWSKPGPTLWHHLCVGAYPNYPLPAKNGAPTGETAGGRSLYPMPSLRCCGSPQDTLTVADWLCSACGVQTLDNTFSDRLRAGPKWQMDRLKCVPSSSPLNIAAGPVLPIG